MDSLAQYESEAKLGRADALYNLGLAYSTGQGVGVDMVAAPQMVQPRPRCAAADVAKNWRNQLATEMSTVQIAQAQKLAREWLNIFK